MAKFGNRVKETSATTGTGTLDLAGAPTGFRAFADEFTSGDTVYYLLVDDVDNPTQYEFGIGTFTNAVPDTLSRDTVHGSSNGGSKVSWIAGCTVVATPTALGLNGGVGFDLAALAQTLAMTGKSILEANGSVAAHATTANIWSSGNYVTLTGSAVTFTDFADAPQAGAQVELYCAAAHVFTDNANLEIDGDANFTAEAGDRVIVRAKSATVFTLRPVKKTGAAVVAPTSGSDNLLINGGFRFNQRVAASNADDTYAHDRWVVLTQTGAIALSTLTDVEDQLPFMARLTQSQASAQRMGLAQIVEGKNCKHLRGQTVTFKIGRYRCSSAQAIRFAVLEWTGTEDSVTSDVVASWTSGTFTAGNFFLGSNLTVSGVAAATPGAATLTTGPDLTVTLGSAFNNLIVMVWTETTAAQNVTLDLGRAKLEKGAAGSEFVWPKFAAELADCQRYYEKSYDLAVLPGTTAGDVAAGMAGGSGFYSNNAPISSSYQFAARKRNASYSFSFWDRDGNGSKFSTYSAGTWTDNIAPGTSGGQLVAGEANFIMYTGTGYAQNNFQFHFAADGEL